VNILIIGGYSFLGLKLLKDLKKNIPLVNIYISTSRKEVAEENILFIDYSNAESINNLLSITEPDYIFHLASSCLRNSSENSLKEGRVRDDNILKALTNSKLKSKIIFVSSMAVFSMSDKEISPMKWCPESDYGHEKLYMINQLLNFEIDNKEFSCKVIYPSSIYGKGQDGKMFLPRFLKHIKKNKLMVAYGGHKKRDYINVKDVVKGLVQLVLNYDKYPSKHIFLHSFSLLKINEIADLVCTIKGLKPSEVIFFQDSKEEVANDAMEYQVVSKEFNSLDEFPVNIPILAGLKEMFNET